MGYNDPLLASQGVDYISYIDTEIDRLQQARQKLADAKARVLPPVEGETKNSISLWASIDAEIESLTDDQRAILAEDEVYRSIDGELQYMIQMELVNSVKDKVANSKRGRELLEKQLANVKDKKSKIVAEGNKQMELFKKFQIAAQANPELTYVEFVKAVKQ